MIATAAIIVIGIASAGGYVVGRYFPHEIQDKPKTLGGASFDVAHGAIAGMMVASIIMTGIGLALSAIAIPVAFILYLATGS